MWRESYALPAIKTPWSAGTDGSFSPISKQSSTGSIPLADPCRPDNVSGPGGGIAVREEKGEDEGRLMLQSTEIFDFHLTILNIYDIVNRR